MRAIGKYLVIKPFDGKYRKSKSDLLVPATKSDRWVEAELVSVPPAIAKEFELKVGDKVLYDRAAGHDVLQTDGDKLRVVTIGDLASVL